MMTIKNKRAPGATVLTALAALGTTAAWSVLACAGSGTSPSAPTWYERTQPRFALADAELVLNHYDRGRLDECLSAGFAFYFDPLEVGKTYNGYQVPVAWDRTTFVRAVVAFYQNTHSMAADNSWRTCGTPTPAETTYYAPNLPFKTTIVIDSHTSYLLDDGKCDYSFERSGGKWTLAKWWDRTYGCGCAGVPVSLGQLLIRYGYRP